MPTVEYITSQVLTSAIATVTFSSIPQNYTDLIVELNVTPSADIDMLGTINNTTTTIYSNTRLTGNGTSVSSYRSSNSSSFLATINNISAGAGVISKLHFMSYSNTAIHKTILHEGARAAAGTQRTVQLWRSNSAISRLDFLAISGTFVAGSKFTIWGVK